MAVPFTETEIGVFSSAYATAFQQYALLAFAQPASTRDAYIVQKAFLAALDVVVKTRKHAAELVTYLKQPGHDPNSVADQVKLLFVIDAPSTPPTPPVTPTP
jgi:hypothetical protein